MLDIVVLAAGKGTRMKSSLPKVLHPVAGIPLLQHVINTARELPQGRFHLVVGHGADEVKAAIQCEGANWVLQAQQLGTGHAVLQALPALQPDARVLILYGDVPLISLATITALLQQVGPGSLGLLTVNLANPTGYGRIVRDSSGAVCAIVEQKDASAAQLQISEVNTGVMAVNQADLRRWLPQLHSDNAQQEYYLTDIIAMAGAEGVTVNTVQPAAEFEVLGVNNRQQQAELERIYQRQLAERLLVDGVTLLDPARFDCRGTLQAGSDVVIDVNCVFEGEVILGNNVHIGPNCVIRDTTLGDHTVVNANSVLDGVIAGNACDIGPFARLRPGTVLADKAKIGNFVETKKSVIGAGSKVNHLSYIGDTTVGKSANIGAGTITCNYDGVNKFRTEIGDGAFIGSNSSLIAPVTIGAGATVGAGSAISRSVEDNELAVARGKQRNIQNWQKPVKQS